VFLESFGGTVKNELEFFDIKRFFRPIGFGDFEGVLLEFTDQLLLFFLAFFGAAFAIQDVGFRHFEMIELHEVTFDDILNILDGRDAIDENVVEDMLDIMDDGIRKFGDEFFFCFADSVTGEDDGMFDARPIEVNDLSVALFYFFDGHEIEVPMRPLNG
jgi:hypothetical protein